MLITVWLFLILGVGPTSQLQAVDHFPSKAACEAFRVNVKQMLDQGLASGSRVTDCLPRTIVTVHP